MSLRAAQLEETPAHLREDAQHVGVPRGHRVVAQEQRRPAQPLQVARHRAQLGPQQALLVEAGEERVHRIEHHPPDAAGIRLGRELFEHVLRPGARDDLLEVGVVLEQHEPLVVEVRLERKPQTLALLDEVVGLLAAHVERGLPLLEARGGELQSQDGLPGPAGPEGQVGLAPMEPARLGVEEADAGLDPLHGPSIG